MMTLLFFVVVVVLHTNVLTQYCVSMSDIFLFDIFQISGVPKDRSNPQLSGDTKLLIGTGALARLVA